MFEDSDRILDKIVKAKILDAHDIATVERALKAQEIQEVLLNESIGISKETKIFDLKYQVAQAFGTLGRPGVCKDCAKCLKQTSIGSNPKGVSAKTHYTCTRDNKETYALNSCVYFV